MDYDAVGEYTYDIQEKELHHDKLKEYHTDKLYGKPINHKMFTTHGSIHRDHLISQK